MTPEQRQQERQRIQQEILDNPVMAMAERALFRAGQSIRNFAGETIPHVEGYTDESWASMLGNGFGSLLAGIPISYLTGPVGSTIFFGSLGSGEANARAVEFDRAERAAGRPGLTQEQIALASLLGVGPGATDAVAVEVLLGRLRIPGMTPQIRTGLARAIAERGGAALRQALVEGLQEGVQGVLQDLIARGYDPKQLIGANLFQETAIGGIIGFISGGLMGRRGPGGPGPQVPPGTPTEPGGVVGGIASGVGGRRRHATASERRARR
jgi:hypothetical protein